MRRDGFTLIELLVVIAIIGILSTLAIVSLGSARQKARDAKRVSDISQISKALELYYSDNNSYPAIITPGQAISANGITYMSAVPSNPQPWSDSGCPSKDYQYGYVPTLSASYALTYCLGSATGSIATFGGPVTYTQDGSDSPLLYLSLEEGTGSTTADKSGSGYNAALVGSPAWTTRAGGGNALDFSSTGEYLSLPAFPIPNNDNSITFAAWVYADGSGLESLIGDGSQGNTAGYIWAYFNNTTLVWQYRHETTYGTDWNVNNVLTGVTNTWIHVVVVADYTTKQLKVYRNGNLLGTSTLASVTPVFPAVSRVRYLGSYNTSPDYNGRMDDVRLYARALSASEIKALYNATN